MSLYPTFDDKKDELDLTELHITPQVVHTNPYSSAQQMEYTSSGSLPDVGSQSYRPDRPDRPPRSPRHYPPPRLHLSNNEQNQSTSAQSLESYPSDYSNSGPQNGSGSSINNFAFVLAPTHSPIAPPDYYAQHHRRTQHLQSHHRTHSHTHSQPHLQIHSHTETPTSPNMISYPSPPREVYDGHNPAYSVGGSSSQSNTDTNTQNEGHPRVLYASDTHSSAGLSEPDLTPPANFNYNMNYPPERPSSTSNNSSNYAPANLGADQSGSEYPPPNSLNSVLYAPNSQPDYAPSAPKSPIEPPLDSPPDLYRRQSETAAPNIGHMPDLRLMTNSSIGVNRINSMFNTALPGGRPVFESPLVAAIDTGEIEYGDIRREDIIVHKEIGRGAFGTVLLGMWKGRTIAIKKSRAGNEELLHEAEMLQKLKHVNIIAVYGIYLDSDSSPCLVLEYCNRGNLFDLIHKGDKNRLLRANGQPAPAEDNELIPFNKLMDYSRQISSGMNYLHNDTEQDNLIHRDLKSPNILISEFNNKTTLKICDFGTARKYTRDTFMTFTGTFAWMAPEILKNQKASKRADVYSFAVVLWEMLTGQEPFAGMDPMSIAWLVMEGECLPIPEGVPEPFKTLLNQCFQTEPEDRPEFNYILKTIEDASQIRDMETKVNTFHATHRTWNMEISSKYEEYKRRKEAISERESKLKQREQELHELEASLAKFQKELEQPTTARPTDS